MKSYIRHLDHNPHYTCMGRAILDDHVSLGIFGGLEFVEEYSYVYTYIYIYISPFHLNIDVERLWKQQSY